MRHKAMVSQCFTSIGLFLCCYFFEIFKCRPSIIVFI